MPERVLTQLPQGVVLVDPKLTIDYANPAAERLLGVGPAGDPLPDPWPEFSLRDLAASLFGSDPPAGGTLLETENRFFWIQGLPPSTAETAIVIVDDVTERERARQSEREFVENAAHELRTPLAAIVSVMDVLESGAKDIPEVRDRFLKHIRVHSDRLSQLATSLLVLARLQTGVEQPHLTLVPVRPLLEEIAGRLDPAHGVEVSVRAAAEIGTLADRDLLWQAIANVAENSAKHTRRGQIVLEARENGATTEIEIRDTGPGMTDEERARAFHRFYRASNGTDGFGLGLAIAEEAAHAIGGTIELESELGTGTRVRVAVPSAKILT
ncbi:MAG: PAS domain-containing sensor histidine kinase [Actinomycetota bacterium]|nr:PAS domain-containing sensor histidine kinase [Actinomycetota bacterium]